ncbi:ferritin-like domain-containing protein [Christiangramia sabulilitoris]|uniref:PA2169 family four-helix-bundle protein n=1 Tax=Christiangramia sabulilitoris TaxID=2583991 RepID=A0A550I846_9FLAO|nr:PA2169 family four-helix-bundle protein [Christiangramia sabulilitoris]TRO67152.1 PA2169 family four-helix-bundle protein [Christiangramia sabulilitoris]
MSYSSEISKKLNELLEKNYDAEKGYKLAAEKVDHQQLKTFFTQRAQERYDFGHELKSEIRNFGEEPDKGSSLAGDVHRSWMNLKASLSGDKDEAVLEEAIRGEKAAIEEYEDILKDSDIPASTGNILLKQKNAIVAALNEVKTLENLA